MLDPSFLNSTVHAAAIALALSALAGCASMQAQNPSSAHDDPRIRAEMQIDHALPAISADPSDDREEMLAGSVHLGAPKGLIDYGARYQVRQGKFFDAIRDGDDPEQAQGEVALAVASSGIDQEKCQSTPCPRYASV